MEIIFGALVLYGIFWAGREGIRAGSTHRANSRQRALSRGGTHNRGGSDRRAARQATAGYWANAIRHGFPVERHGFTQGWREHQQAMTERQRDGAKHQADLAHLLTRLRAETAAHRHRMLVAQRMGPPTMSAQLRATPVRGQAASTPSPVMTGDPHMGAPTATCTNKQCSCHANTMPPLGGQTPGTPPANGQAPPAPTNGGSGMDYNLDQIVELAGKLKDHADNAVAESDLDQAPVMADAIGHLVPTDATTNGLAGDVAAASLKIKEGNAELLEASAALQQRAEETYRNLQ